MARTSPCYYISPSAISISPNANGSASDLAVNVVKGAKIKVYSQGISVLGWSDSVFKQWTLTGRNRRLADSSKPYTIYARLNKINKDDGYLVFAPKEADGDNWLDKYAYVTMQGLAPGTANKNSKYYWYIKLGEVSLPTDNARTVSLDTGILGTDQFNTEWNLDPDDMPLRVELSATIDLKYAGDKPYVPWGKELVLRAKLLQGWANTNIQRFHHWTIRRDTGDAKSDAAYNYPSTNGDGTVLSSGRQMPGGNIALSHARGEGDVFNGTVSSLWTVTAWGTKTDSEGVAPSDSSSSSSSSTDSSSSSSSSASSSSSLPSEEAPKETYEKLAETTINILAETVEQFALELSSGVVNYDPSSDTYSPADGIDVMVRATDQKGDVFKLTNAQLKAAGLSVQYSLTNLNQWNTCTFSGADTDVASANIPIEAFHLQQNVDVRILKIVTPATAETTATTKEIFRSHIALVRNGEDSKEREWIFLRSKTALQFSTDAKDTSKPLIPSLINGGEVKPEEAATGDDTNKNQDGWVPEGWWDEMRGTDSTYHYEYAAYRDYVKDSASSSSSSSGNAAQRGGHWGDFTAPRIWSYYAEDAVYYRCRFTLAGVEVYQLKCAYTGAFRGTLPLVVTLLKRVGSGQEQEVTGKAVVTLKCEGIDYSKTFNVDNPSFTVSTTDVNTADFVQYLNKVELNGLSVSFTVDGETYNFSIPVIREADEDSVKETIDSYGSQKFLRKDIDDTASGLVTFLKGLESSGDAKSSGFLSASEGGTPAGWALRLLQGIATGELDDLIVRRDAKVKDLTVTGAAHFFKLIIDEIKSAGGSVLLTPANGFIAENVTHHGTTGAEDERYILYWKDSDGEKTIDNQWQVGDFAVCMTANLKQGVSHNAGNKTWWCKVVDAGNAGGYNYISLDWYNRAQGRTITEGGKTFTEASSSGVPEKGDNVAMLGSVATDKDGNFDYKRQSAIYLAAYDSLDLGIETPFLAFYYGIDDFCLSRHRKTHLSRLATNVVADKFTLRSDDEEYPLSVFFGDWNSETTYPKAGVVSYNGCTWTSLKDENNGNTPSSSSEWWVSNKGEKGDYIDIAFKLNGTEVGSLDYKAIKEMGTAEFEVDFTNDGMEYNAAKATLGCYDGEGNLLGSEIVSTDASNIVADVGNLYLGKDCRTILCTIYDATGKKVRAEGIAVLYVEDGDDATSIRMELRTTPFADMYHEGDSYNATFTLVVFETKGGNAPADITSTIPTTRFRWTRTTKRGVSSDTGWNDIHANVGPVLTLTEKDLDGDTYFLGELLSADGTKTLKAVSMNI